MQEKFLFVLWSSLAVFASSGADQELFIGLITENQDINSTLYGVQHALHKINYLLSGYKLGYINSQIECSRISALNGLLGMILNSSHKLVALIGSECSTAAEAAADISSYFNLTQISCASSSNELSDRVRFPYYFQLLPSEVNLAHVFYSIIKEYGWRRVALIVQNEHRYRAMTVSLKEMLSDSNPSKGGRAIAYVEMVIDYEKDLNNSVFDSQSRIFVIATDSRFARELLCKAHGLGMKYPQYLFLTYGTYETQWWTIEDETLTNDKLKCNPDDIAEVLEFSLAALYFSSFSTNVSFTMKESDSITEHELQNKVYHQCFDAASVLMLALNKTIKELNLNQTLRDEAIEQAGLGNDYTNFTLSNFNYNVSIITNHIKNHLQDTNFTGVSGPVHFNENGVRDVTELSVLQYRTSYRERYDSDSPLHKALRLVNVATVLKSESGLKFLKGTKYDVWPSYTPIDGVPDTKLISISLPVAVVLMMLNACGIVFSIICLIFIIYFRNKKLIRLSSPNLNYLMISGMLLVYLSGIAYGSPKTNPPITSALCFVKVWMFTIGYSCGIGTIVAKLWRVYYIFSNPQKKKSTIQDWHLILFVFIIVLADVLFMVLNILLEGIIINFDVIKTTNKEKPSIIEGEVKAQTDLFIYHCFSKSWIRSVCLAIPFGCQFFLHLFALYFAFNTRKVKVKGLNDARNAAMVVIIVSTIYLVFNAAAFSLYEYITAYSVITSICAWMTATTVLAIIFIPKMVRLYKDPDGTTVFTTYENPMPVTALTVTAVQCTNHSLNGEINTLRKRVKELENTMVAYKKLIGIDLNNNILKSSISMINIHTQDNMFQEKKVKPSNS